MNTDKKIYELRQSKNLSQDELAELIGVSRQSISKWENGTAVPGKSNISKLCEIFSVSVSYLLDDDYNKETVKSNDDDVNSNFNETDLKVKNIYNKKFKIGLILFVTSLSVLILFSVLSSFITSYNNVTNIYSAGEIVFLDENKSADTDWECSELTETTGLIPFLNTYNLIFVYIIVWIVFLCSLIVCIKEFKKERKIKNEQNC